MVDLLGQLIRGLVFGGKWLEIIFQSQIRGDYIFTTKSIITLYDEFLCISHHPYIGHTPVKMKKMIKAKMLLSPGLLHHHHHHHPSPITPASHLHLQEDHSAKMYTWSPYSSHMMYNELQHHHHHAHGAGKSLDELRF